MAGYVRNLGSATGTASATTLAITLANAVAAGETIIVRVSQDSTTGGPTMADTKGNTYVRDRTSQATDISAVNVARNSTFRCYVTTPLVVGDVMTVTFSVTITNRIAIADQFSGLVNAVDAQNGFTGTAAGFGAGGAVGSTFAPTVAAATVLVAAVYALEPSSDTYEISAAYAPLTRAGVGNHTLMAAVKTMYASGTYSFTLKLPSGVRYQLHLFSYELTTAPVDATSSYATVVTGFAPAAFYRFTEASGEAVDEIREPAGRGVANGTVGRRAGTAVAGIPSGSLSFSGSSGNYLEIPDAAALSVTTTGELTIAVLLRPDTLDFALTAGDDPPTGDGLYVHWMGKGNATDGYEWLCRMYSKHLASNPALGLNDRPNRISGYHFNSAGALGSGSYFQDTISPGAWILYVLTFNATGPSIFRDGLWRDSDFYSDFGVTPVDTSATLRLGSANGDSYFQGAIGPLAIWNRRLTDDEIYRLQLAVPVAEPASPAPTAGTTLGSGLKPPLQLIQF